MQNKKQHYVPCVYMKAWETQVETFKEPDKKFKGVYVIREGNMGEGANSSSVLYKPHLYTIRFKHLFIYNSCPKVKSQFIDMIYNLLREKLKKPVYGKLKYSIIKTKKSIRKHLDKIYDWEFYYDDGSMASRKVILRQIEEFKSYILENAFDDYFEKKWERILKEFVDNVHNGKSVGIGRSERIISNKVAKEMLESFFIMFCRNPKFNAMGIYTLIKENFLSPMFELYLKNDYELENLDYKIKDSMEYADELLDGIWLTELYKIFFDNQKGFYHNSIQFGLNRFQMILFETYDNACSFITSDNPAVEYKSFAVEKENRSGLIFPISPKHLVFIAKGDGGMGVVDYRLADSETVKMFNRIINAQKMEFIISSSNNLRNLI